MKNAYFMTDRMSCKFCTQGVLEKFMKEYGDRLFNEFFSKHTIRMPYQEMKQEFLIVTAKALEAYDETRMDIKLTTYVWVCWKNALKTICRRQAGLQLTAAENLTVSIEDAKDEMVDPISEVDEQLYVEYQNALVHKAINNPKTGLTQEEKNITDMIIEGHSQKKIAKQIGCSPSKISTTYNRALNKIREAITKNEQPSVANRKAPEPQNDEYSCASQVAKAFWDVIVDPSTGFSNEEIFIFGKLYEGYSLIDVAQLLGKSHCWIKKMYKNCIKKIQIALGSLKIGM